MPLVDIYVCVFTSGLVHTSVQIVAFISKWQQTGNPTRIPERARNVTSTSHVSGDYTSMN